MTLPIAQALPDASRQPLLLQLREHYAELASASRRLADVQSAYEDLLRECPAVAANRDHPGYRLYSGALRASSTARINFNNAVAALRRTTGLEVSPEELIRAWSAPPPARH